MADALVLCGGARSPEPGATRTIRLALSGQSKNLDLKIEDIGRRMLADVPPVLTDLLEIAAYVYCADQLVSRGGAGMSRLGRDWRREMRFVIPVRVSELWNDGQIKDNLERLLAFMSEDEMLFDFVPADSPPGLNSYLPLSPDERASFQPEAVLLFSGGLDSLCGAVEQLERRNSSAVLVSHQSSTKVARHQRELAGTLRERFRGKLLHVPVRITKKGITAIEDTQRSRSFLFAVVALVVSRLSGVDSLRFSENGVVSFNLPIARQVVGARATRSTHPRVLRDLEAFFSALLGTTIRVDNPYVWKTKTEVVSLINESGYAELIPHSVSCSHTHGMTRLKTHCGRCSQCLDRRFATLAANLGDADPEEMYDTDLLTGARKAGPDRTMTQSYILHAQELKRMNELAFVGRFGAHISRAFAGFPKLTPEQVTQQSFDLHRRHGEAVVSVLGDGFQSYAYELAQGTLPADCLLRIAGGGEAGSQTGLPANAMQSAAPDKPPDPRDFRRTSEIVLALDPGRKQVMIEGMPPMKGVAPFSLLERLVEAYDQDRSAKRKPVNHQYVDSHKLARSLAIPDYTLRRRVMRLRRAVANAFQTHFGLSLADDALVQSKHWKGYRLNPHVRVIALDQLGKTGAGHDSETPGHD